MPIFQLIDYNIDSVTLSRTDTVKDLGVHFDSKLSFSTHIDQIVSSSIKMLGFIFRIGQDFQDRDVLSKLYFAYVRSKLEYCSLVWNPIYDCYVSAIESVQKKFLKYLSFRADGTYPARNCDYGQLLKRFSLDSLTFRRNFSGIKFLYQLLHNNIDSPWILSRLNFSVPRLNNRTSYTFYNPVARTNILLKSPIVSMCSNFNSICSSCDIANCSVQSLLNVFRDSNNSRY